mgnify:CR=1 FL=1
MLHPLAITMWDFSWIERRWDGAGFEDWNAALDGVKERGYDAVRIDAFPHLLSQAPEKEWLLLPVWYSNDWGSPYKVRVRLFPALIDFLKACRARRIKVALAERGLLPPAERGIAVTLHAETVKMEFAEFDHRLRITVLRRARHPENRERRVSGTIIFGQLILGGRLPVLCRAPHAVERRASGQGQQSGNGRNQ